MKISRFTGGFVQTNGYLLETQAGNYLFDAPAGISAWLQERGVVLNGLFLTHQHYDHVEDVAALQKLGVKVYAWADYSKDLTLESFGSSFGLPQVAPFHVDEKLVEGEVGLIGTPVTISHVPGHSPDSITFYFRERGLLIAGDTLFAGSVGRCDLPGGSFEILLSGIRRELLSLPDETRVLSGHGPETTIGSERVNNGYLQGA